MTPSEQEMQEGEKPEQSDREPHTTVETTGKVPEDVLILIPVRNLVLFPGVVLPVMVGRQQSIVAAQEAVRSGRRIGLLLQRTQSTDAPQPIDLYTVGTVASILRYVTTPDGNHHLICQGEQRFRVVDFVEGFPFLIARIDLIEESHESNNKEIEARWAYLRNKAEEAISLLPQAPPELLTAVQNIPYPSVLADLVTSFMDVKIEEKQEILESFELHHRLDRVIELLNHRLEVLRLTKKLEDQTQESMNQQQRHYMLREQLKAIRKELGEEEEANSEIQALKESIEAAHMPEEALTEATKELRRLEHMPEAAAEFSMVRTYLDWLTSLPWSLLDEESIDIAKARQILNDEHYGLEKIKKRILEYLAVRKMNPEGRSPILCFAGPPGVGKTSLGHSIANALGLKFVRASLGGVHDEAEIRGHRRTYIGALPGNIIQAIRKVKSRNPVFMLDEVDKLGSHIQGDPASALLEVLDPEQNSTFRDHYLGVSFDLSKVFFIATANVLDNIPPALRDRMEVIELPGYTEQEKLEIARRYLVARQLKANGLKPELAEIDESALRSIICDYTREAGVRNLEREIGAVFRNSAMRISEGSAQRVSICEADLNDILGPKKFESEIAMRTSVPGVSTGLAWTPAGGDILFIETSAVPGNGKLILTGQLGDVMKESAQAALSLVKSRAKLFGIEANLFESHDLHIHVPAGAIPKDGPSAGVAIFVSLLSQLTAKNVRPDVAMTGEISLRGLVLPVGGIKEKTLAASRAGIQTILLPARNRKDLEDIPEAAREQLKFVWLNTVDDAIANAFEDGATKASF